MRTYIKTMFRFTILRTTPYVRCFCSNYSLNNHELCIKLRLLETKIERLEQKIDPSDYMTNYMVQYNKRSKKKLKKLLTKYCRS